MSASQAYGDWGNTTVVPYGDRYCSIHGYYYGAFCPTCSTSVPVSPPQPQVKIEPQTAIHPVVGTEDAVAAMIKAFLAEMDSLRREKDELADRLRALGEEV